MTRAFFSVVARTRRASWCIDETGFVWSWLTDARDPAVIAPDAIVLVGDGDALAVGRIVDLVEEERGTVVHVDVLPGPVDGYVEAVNRFVAPV